MTEKFKNRSGNIKVINALYEKLLGISGQFFCGYN